MDRVLLHGQRWEELVPTRLGSRGVVEGRQLVVLQFGSALLHRLQRVVRRMRVRRRRHVRPGLCELQLPLRVGYVRRTVHVLQPVPLRTVQPGSGVCRADRVPGRHLYTAVVLRRDVYDDERDRERDRAPRRTLPSRVQLDGARVRGRGRPRRAARTAAASRRRYVGHAHRERLLARRRRRRCVRLR